MKIGRILILLLIVCPGLLLAEQHFDCFTIVAGRDATVDGSILVAHNEDDKGRDYLVNIFKVPAQDHRTEEYLVTRKGQKIPQIYHTFGYLWFQIPGVDFADSYINEHGLIIVSNACSSREKGKDLNTGIGYLLRRIIAQRAQTAREGVRIAGDLIEKYGYYSSGRNYTIADSNEAWFLQVVRGKHWIAQRIPDNRVAVIANYYTITRIDLKDSKNYMGSTDLLKYSINKKWYAPDKNKDFDFAEVYSDPPNLIAEGNILRQWRGINLLADNKFSVKERFPFAFIPKRKVALTDLLAVLRDHYEGTKYDLTNKYKKGSPNFTSKRTICTESTKYSLVAQLRNDKPKLIKDILWVSLGRPDSNAFTPWHIHALKDIPEGYKSEGYRSALKTHFLKPDSFFTYEQDHFFSKYAILSNLVDNDYRKRRKLVGKEWKRYESYIFKSVRKYEKEFEYLISINPKIARNIIDNFFKRYEYRKLIKVIEFINLFNLKQK
jgi:dipeptidase